MSGYSTAGADSARVILGNATAPFSSIDLAPPTSTDTTTQFGWSVTGAGDINNDGFADVVVGARGDGNGKAHVYFGGATMNATSDATFTGPDVVHTGWAVAGGSDVNGNGIADIVISAPYYSTSTPTTAGRVYVLHGGTTFNTAADKTLDGVAEYSYSGWAVGL